ncbi:hypothetical protein P7C71_g2768, partial [Lecanoromycetidae sp. Uapishka_2]
MAIILIVLAIFNNQPLHRWHSGLSLNTLINVLSQVAQTAVTVPIAASIAQMKWIWYSKRRPIGEMEDFDKAIRGPIDSLWMVRKHPKWFLVYLAALNTGLILLLGPFAQQSVSLPLRQVNSTANSGSIPSTQQYSFNSTVQSLAIVGDQGVGFGTFSTLPSLMISALINGLLSPDTISPSAVAATCDTGNCTFPDYTALAVCTSTEDVTSTLLASCPQGTPEIDVGCNYTVPALQKFPTYRDDNFNTQGGVPTDLWIGASAPNLDNTTSSYFDNKGLLNDFYILFFPDPSVLSGNSKANGTASLVALHISIALCLKTYRTTVTSGSTSTDVIGTQSPVFSDKDAPGFEPSPTVPILETTTDSGGNEYFIESDTRLAFASYFAIATFFGTYSAPSNTSADPNDPGRASSDAARAFGEIFYGDPSPDHIAAIAPLLTNLETALSNAMRSTSDHPSNITGTSTYEETFISVDFRWLVLPIFSIALSLLFLVAVALVTRKSEVPLWKDKIGKVLTALEPETRLRMEGLDDSKDGVGAVPVVFERDGGRGWCLRGPGEEWWARQKEETGFR